MLSVILTFVITRTDPMMYALQQSMRLPGIVIDVGANGGQQTTMALNANRRVLSIECLASAYVDLLKRFEGNPNVTLVHTCVGSNTGLNVLNLADDSSDLIKRNIENGPEYAKAKRSHNERARNRQHVLTVRLGDIVREPVALLKIDTQGFEYDVLLGAQSIMQTSAPVVMFEHTKHFEKNGDPFGFLRRDYDCEHWGGDFICVHK